MLLRLQEELGEIADAYARANELMAGQEHQWIEAEVLLLRQRTRWPH